MLEKDLLEKNKRENSLFWFCFFWFFWFFFFLDFFVFSFVSSNGMQI